MENTTIRQELLDKYSSKLAGSSAWAAISEEQAKKYKNRNIKIYNPANTFNKIEISDYMISDIATNYSLYASIIAAFTNQQLTTFKFHYKSRYDLGTIEMSRYMLMQGLEHMLSDPKYQDLSPQLNFVYEQILNISSLDTLADHYKGTVEYTIDGQEYEFSPRTFFNLLKLSDADFSFFIENYDQTSMGMPIEHFLYSFSKFTNDQKIYNKAYLNEEQLSRFQQICDYQIADFQSVNYLTENLNFYLDETHLNPELQAEILDEMPQGYSDLQKAQYIYLKLCQTLTYDTEFYAVNQCGPRAAKHKKIENIPNITPTNNNAVCYEFAAIYGKLLTIATPSITQEMVFKNGYFGSGTYGEDHTYIDFRCGKYMVSADSVMGIFTSDMTNQKLGRPSNGLKCSNLSKETIKEFNQSLIQVKKDLQQQTQEKLAGNLPTTFEDAVFLYRQETEENQVYIDIPTRLGFCFDQIKDSQLTGIDAYSYLLQLRKIVFDKKEQHENVAMQIIREGTDNTESQISLAAIVTLSHNYRDPEEECSYLVYKPETGPEDISKEDLMAGFNSGFYSYVSQKDEAVPCIEAPVCSHFILNKALE
ncbi:MAG: hypothetical protein IJB10_00230 [Clostridia bacterium]|nr:hypothetical protein [Clostridia bacterium]